MRSMTQDDLQAVGLSALPAGVGMLVRPQYQDSCGLHFAMQVHGAICKPIFSMEQGCAVRMMSACVVAGTRVVGKSLSAVVCLGGLWFAAVALCHLDASSLVLKKKYEKKVLPHTGSCHDSRCKKQKNGICHVPLLAGPRLLVSQLKTAWHATSDCGLAHDGTFEREQLSRVIDYYQETCLMEK